MKQNKKIAVTGGIGSGKSTVIKILADKGYPVFSCDEIYAQLTGHKDFLRRLADEFGDVCDAGGHLDREKLAAIVFADEKKLARLNEITHPAIFEEMFSQADGAGGTCFCEVPLLFESGAEGMFDGVIVVLRDLNERIKSVAARSNLSRDSVVSRINSQFDYDNCNFAMYYVIHNNGNIEQLRAEVDKIIHRITEDKP